MLFHDDFHGLVIQIGHKGVKVLEDDGRRVEVEVGAGEVWHDFVIQTIEKGWGGMKISVLYLDVLEQAQCRILVLTE